MKKTFRMIAIAALTTGISYSSFAAGPVYSVNVVGFQKNPIGAGNFNIISTPFTQTSNTVNETLAGQLTANTSFGPADKIHIFNGVSYVTYFRHTADGLWKNAGLVLATDTLSTFSAFWIQNSGGASQTVVTVGDVIDAPVVTNTINTGFQIIAYPYSAPIDLNNSNLTNMMAAGTFAAADKLHFFNGASYVTYFLHDVDRQWKTAGLALANEVLEPNRGFWAEHKGAGFDWVETKPYSYP